MKLTFLNIKEGDKLYIVYKDWNNNFQIGEAIVTGFKNWTYINIRANIGNRYDEEYEEKPQINILYEFNNIKFSRNLEYLLNNTHFTDSLEEYDSKYKELFNSEYVETFTTYNEANEYIIDRLNYYIKLNNKEIEKIKNEIQHYHDNLKLFEK